MRIYNLVSAVLAISLCSTVAIAQPTNPGANDYSFSPGTGASSINTIALQGDGKIIIGGAFAQYNGTYVNNIARLNSDGSRDESFSSGWGSQGTGGVGSSAVRVIIIQNDGKIIIGGDFTSYNDQATMYLARLKPSIVIDNGILDETFVSAVNSPVTASAVQSDGKIIVGGGFHPFRIGRLNPDGSSDNTFNPGAGVVNLSVPTEVSVNTLAIQGDGKIIVGGQFSSYDGTARNHIARLNADGSIDETFDPGAGTNYPVYTTAVLPDGKIIIGGAFTTYDGTVVNGIARLNTDGSLDESFGSGLGANNRISSLSIQSDGKIIIGGQFTSFNGTLTNGIARLNADGGVDENFDTGDGVQSSDGSAFTVGSVLATAIQNDGKIMVGGSFRYYNGANRMGVARVLSGISTSVENNYLKQTRQIAIYPNPNNGLFQMQVSSLELGHRFDVYSMLGIHVASGLINSDLSTIDLKGTGSGIYMLRLINAEGQTIHVSKLQIE